MFMHLCLYSSSEDPEEQHVVGDAYDCLSQLASQPVSLDAFMTHQTVTALCQAVAHRCLGMCSIVM